jgi:6-phosphogluconolactonase
MMRIIKAGPDLNMIAASVIADALRDRAALCKHVSFAVSGGQTPWSVFRLLSQEAIPWTRVDLYQVDERVAPPQDPARNQTGLTESLLERVPAPFHPMPVESHDLVAAAESYASELPKSLDVIHLGLGDDGHTASLVPGDVAVLVEDRDVAITDPYRGHRRMTLTRPALDRAGLLVWIVAGRDKAEMVERLLAGDPTIPAGLVSQDRAVLITDSI